ETEDDDRAVAIRLGGVLPADETQLLYSIALAGRAELVLAPDEYSGLVMILLRMLAFAPAERRDALPTPSPGPASAPSQRPADSPLPRAVEAVAPQLAGPAREAPDQPTVEGTRAADLWV